MRPEGWGLVVSLPCRPAGHSRTLPLAGVTVEMSLLACSAQQHTFAIASADMQDPARVAPALLALAEAARANVQGVPEAERAASVAGMTPQAAARQWRLHGRLPDGQAVREQGLVFAHGARVFQATLVGPVADDAMAQAYFETIAVLR